MRHWLRNLPDIDDDFVNEHVEPLEALYKEHEEIAILISRAELNVHQSVFKRWSPEQIDDSFNNRDPRT